MNFNALEDGLAEGVEEALDEARRVFTLAGGFGWLLMVDGCVAVPVSGV